MPKVANTQSVSDDFLNADPNFVTRPELASMEEASQEGEDAEHNLGHPEPADDAQRGPSQVLHHQPSLCHFRSSLRPITKR